MKFFGVFVYLLQICDRLEMHLIKTIIIQLYVSFVTEPSYGYAKNVQYTRRKTCELSVLELGSVNLVRLLSDWLSVLFFYTCFDFCVFGYLDHSRTSGRYFENGRMNEKRAAPRTPESKTNGRYQGWPANDRTRIEEVRPMM